MEDIPFDRMFHIEKKLGKLGFENPQRSNWGEFVQFYHSYSAARKAQIGRSTKLCIDYIKAHPR